MAILKMVGTKMFISVTKQFIFNYTSKRNLISKISMESNDLILLWCTLYAVTYYKNAV